MTRLIRKLFKEKIMNKEQWFLIENEIDYKKAIRRYEQLREAKRGTSDHKEKMLLVHLINKYENAKWPSFEMDPVEIIKIRMEEFGYKPSDLAREYGDKGTISKVLNYKQPLSLNMIRLFNKMLRIPTDLLTKEYKLS
jgi:HTH-type transcriptional regulator / antitoxin HigA